MYMKGGCQAGLSEKIVGFDIFCQKQHFLSFSIKIGEFFAYSLKI